MKKQKNIKRQMTNSSSPLPTFKNSFTSGFCLFIFALGLFLSVPSFAKEITKAQRDEVGKELACLCSTCPRRPLDECTCGYAQQQQARIDGLLAEGKTKQQVIDIFIADFGKEVLSKPPAEGFNLTAWLMPPIVLIFGFFMVRSVLQTWAKSKPTPATAAGPDMDKSDPYLDRIEQELRERDS